MFLDLTTKLLHHRYHFIAPIPPETWFLQWPTFPISECHLWTLSTPTLLLETAQSVFRICPLMNQCHYWGYPIFDILWGKRGTETESDGWWFYVSVSSCEGIYRQDKYDMDNIKSKGYELFGEIEWKVSPCLFASSSALSSLPSALLSPATILLCSTSKTSPNNLVRYGYSNSPNNCN